MHIEFDNSARLYRNVYYFEYKEIRYKLIQNNFRKWRDVLITIVENHNDKKAINYVYILASEYLSALSWQNDSKVSMRYAGGIGVPENVSLKKAESKIHNFRPQISFSEYSGGYFDICEIPNIETEEQKIALTLFREALHSNNEYLTFLFFWQVLDTGENKPHEWVDDTLSTSKDDYFKYKVNEITKTLPLRGNTLGNYLRDDCRNAIGHIKRDHGVQLKLDTPEDKLRISISTQAVKELAKYYIESELKLNKKLYLIRKNGRGFPIYVNEEYMKQYPCVIAYKKLTLDQIGKRKKH
jgi:hypothetical protein